MAAIASFIGHPLSAEQLDMVYERSTLDVMRALEDERQASDERVTPLLGRLIDQGI